MRNPVHPVANANVGLDVNRVGGICFNFLSECCHKYPDQRRIRFRRIGPDVGQDIMMRQNFADIFRQKAQQFIFNGSQMNLLPAHKNRCGRIIDLQIAILKERLVLPPSLTPGFVFHLNCIFQPQMQFHKSYLPEGNVQKLPFSPHSTSGYR